VACDGRSGSNYSTTGEGNKEFVPLRAVGMIGNKVEVGGTMVQNLWEIRTKSLEAEMP